MELVARQVTYPLDKEVREDHEFLRPHNLKRVINYKTLAVAPGDKDSFVIVIKRADYIAKMQTMIFDNITCGVYTSTTDNRLKDLKTFRHFLCRNFKDHPKYKKMLPTSNQPARLYGTAKTHNFASPDIIIAKKLKFRPIIAQTGTYTYNADQVIAEY